MSSDSATSFWKHLLNYYPTKDKHDPDTTQLIELAKTLQGGAVFCVSGQGRKVSPAQQKNERYRKAQVGFREGEAAGTGCEQKRRLGIHRVRYKL